MNNNYYEKNSKTYIETTINCDMKDQYNFFLKHMKNSGTILDIGFGSGRDMIHFKSLGFSVEGLDPTVSFVENMKAKGYTVHNKTIEEFSSKIKYDGIWACASLLHVKRNDLKDTLVKCINMLKEDGVMYCSFKYGTFEGIKNERYFNYLNEELFSEIIKDTNITIVDTLITNDVRLDRSSEKWLNIILK